MTGAFWLTFGAVLDPQFGSFSNYATDPSDPASGLQTVGFNAALGKWSPHQTIFSPIHYTNTTAQQPGFFLLWMGVLCLVYLICALRTNLVFVGIFFTLVLAFGFLTAAYWYTADGNAVLAGRMQIAGGACSFVTCLLGWWIFMAIMLAALDFPFQIPGKYLLAEWPLARSCADDPYPVGDLSSMIKGASERQKSNA